MVSAEYKKKGITIKHVWFAHDIEEGLQSKSDLVIIHGITCGREKDFYIYQNTWITNLTEELSEIQKGIKKNYRYEIRRATKEDIFFKIYTADDVKKNKDIINKFSDVYNQMYRDKGLKAKFNQKLIEAYVDNNAIVFTVAYYQEKPMVFHSYIVGENQVRFLYSASPFRAQKESADIIGRMNKALHWFDIQTFKKEQVSEYDWGGISNIESPNGIDRFKMSFPGVPKMYKNIYISKSLKGKIILTCLRIKGIRIR